MVSEQASLVAYNKVEFYKPKDIYLDQVNIFDPRKSWDSNIAWENKATELAKLFIANFNQFCDSENGKNLVKFGPQV